MDFNKYITPTIYSRTRLITRIIKKFIPGNSKYCEIGCGVGLFLKTLETLGVVCVGFDCSYENIRLAKKSIKSPLIRLEEKNLFEIEEKFDVVFLFEVLEHIENDEEALKYIATNILNDNGMVLMSVPGAKWMFADMDRCCGHFRHYSRKDLDLLFKKCGLTPVVFWNYGFSIVSIGVILLYKLFHITKSEDLNYSKATDESGRMSIIPKAWIYINPFISKLYKLIYVIDFLLKDFNIGIGHLVLCKKTSINIQK